MPAPHEFFDHTGKVFSGETSNRSRLLVME
jgi:hypothetical protein